MIRTNFLIVFLFFSSLCCKEKKPSVILENSVEQKEDSTKQAIIIKESPKTEINYEKQDTLIKLSEPFLINGINCFWEFELTLFEGATGGNGILKLMEYDTHKVLLLNGDYYRLDLFNIIDKDKFGFNQGFKDANFDGDKDFVAYSYTGSGSGGSFNNVYLFDKEKNIFELSEELSGGELNINTNNKTVSTQWKMGVGWHSSRVHHFDINGKMKFTEQTTYEAITVDSIGLWEKTYTKIIKNEIVEKEIDTTDKDW